MTVVKDDRLRAMWNAQRAFSRIYYDVGEMDTQVRESKTRELALALHHEVSKLVSCVNFRGHRPNTSIDRDRIVYEAVDVVRYAMAICNLWNFDDVDFDSAWWDKDYYLNKRVELENRFWRGEPVFIVDIDDVLADFRAEFAAWIREKKGVDVDDSSPEYFFIEQIADTGKSSIELYREFIRDRRTATLSPTFAVDVVNELYDMGAWVHLVTARPRENLLCRYDTFHWLRECGVKFHDIEFTHEKLTHVTQTKYAKAGHIVACIDDSPNHVRSYVAHGFRCCMPIKSYNKDVADCDLLFKYKTRDELYIGLRRAWQSWEKSKK